MKTCLVVNRFILGVMLLVLSACGDDDVSTVDAPEQGAGSNKTAKKELEKRITAAKAKLKAAEGQKNKVTMENIVEISNIEFKDIAVEDFSRQLTAHIKATEELFWIGFQAEESAPEKAQQAAMAWLTANSMEEGWDQKKKQFASLEASRSELGCCLAALATNAGYLKSPVRAAQSVSVNAASPAKSVVGNLSPAAQTIGGIQLQSHSGQEMRIDGAAINERRAVRLEVSLPGQSGQAIYTSEVQSVGWDKEKALFLPSVKKENEIKESDAMKKQISHRVDGKEAKGYFACVLIFKPGD